MPKAESLWQWVESRTGRTAVMAAPVEAVPHVGVADLVGVELLAE